MKSFTLDHHKLNFGAGPAILPEEVFREASEAIIEYKGSGMSILEIPHRSKLFDDILEENESFVRELCELKNDYEVLWLQGGGRMQFCMVPMNFLAEGNSAGYLDSGHWSSGAIEYARYYGNPLVLGSSKDSNYNQLPAFPHIIPTGLSYIHLTTNNTIYGTQWNDLPEAQTPLVADMSSDILSRKRTYNRCGLFYAAVQKNIGPAGATLVVIHKDMLQRSVRKLPSVLDYSAQVKNKSVLNTPPVFAIYVSLLMLRWTKAKSIETIEQESIEKANLLYDEIERNTIFFPTVSLKEHRSRMNVCFTSDTSDNEKGFANFCDEQGIVGVEGHRSVGGFRVSLYNAMPLSGVQRLVDAMQEYERITQNSK
jgi:phosphoserine aminotransferase